MNFVTVVVLLLLAHFHFRCSSSRLFLLNFRLVTFSIYFSCTFLFFLILACARFIEDFSSFVTHTTPHTHRVCSFFVFCFSHVFLLNGLIKILTQTINSGKGCGKSATSTVSCSGFQTTEFPPTTLLKTFQTLRSRLRFVPCASNTLDAAFSLLCFGFEASRVQGPKWMFPIF